MKQHQHDYSYGPKLFIKLGLLCVGLIACAIAASQVSSANTSEVNKLEIELEAFKREGSLKCANAAADVERHIGTMYLADPLKFSQLEEDMIEKAKSERPELYATLQEKKADKTRICTQVAVQQIALEQQLESRRNSYF